MDFHNVIIIRVPGDHIQVNSPADVGPGRASLCHIIVTAVEPLLLGGEGHKAQRVPVAVLAQNASRLQHRGYPTGIVIRAGGRVVRIIGDRVVMSAGDVNGVAPRSPAVQRPLDVIQRRAA